MSRAARLWPVLLLAGCAEWRAATPTFPREAEGQPLVHEQALVAFTPEGDALVAELVDAGGAPPRLELRRFDRSGGPTRTLLVAAPAAAREASAVLLENGRATEPLLPEILESAWPECLRAAREQGEPRPGARAAEVRSAAGASPLSLEVGAARDPDARVLFLRLGDDSVELARFPLAGAALETRLWTAGGAAWMLAGSVDKGPPLRRAVGLRRASLGAGEARLRVARARRLPAEAARGELERALAADPRNFDALYALGVLAARAGDPEGALARLRSAATVDRDRLQVLGRNEPALSSLRERAEGRALLGLVRPPRTDVPPPP